MYGDTRKTTLKKDIGIRLRTVRKSMGFTQDKMVGFFDCGRANYSRIEKGEVFPNPTMLEVLYHRFNISLHWLICNIGEMKPARPENVQAETGNPGKSSSSEEIQELLFYLEKVPMIRHAVLGFFLEYMEENKKLIAPFVGRHRPSSAKM